MQPPRTGPDWGYRMRRECFRGTEPGRGLRCVLPGPVLYQGRTGPPVPYDVRDILGHWVRPPAREGGHCPHACCRNRRPHPDKFPLLWPTAELHRASERQLMYHLREHCHDERCAKQVVRELDRRENAIARRARAKGRRLSRDAEFRAHLENEWGRA